MFGQVNSFGSPGFQIPGRRSLRDDPARPRPLPLPGGATGGARAIAALRRGAASGRSDQRPVLAADVVESSGASPYWVGGDAAGDGTHPPNRKSVVSGKSVSVRVALGGTQIYKKKKS